MEGDHTWAELADMHLAYGAADGNSREAQRLYRDRFPNRVCPNHHTFASLDRRLRENGTFHVARRDAGRPRTVRTAAFEEEVLGRFADNPRTSTRAVAKQLHVHQRQVWDVVHDNHLHPFHLQRVQNLEPADHPLRVQFAQRYLDQEAATPGFHAQVLFTDESCFTQDGIFNSRNSHVWAEMNPHARQVHDRQHRFSVNVWAGIVSDRLIGPYLLPARLNGPIYLRFLTDVLPDLLDDVPYAIRNGMWFQHDGAPPHFALNVRQHLHATFGDRWIGRGGPVSWPPRSPDLTPLDFYLWGWMKELVYATPVADEQDLVARIVEAAFSLKANPAEIARSGAAVLRRMRLCVQQRGGHFEPLL